jgi:hypothetical protein
LKDRGVDRRTGSKMAFRAIGWERWTEFTWLRIGTRGGLW